MWMMKTQAYSVRKGDCHPMKKAVIALVIILLLLAGAITASAVELKTGKIRAYEHNILTVTSEEGGSLTIEAFSGTIPLENPVTNMKIAPGTTEIPWDGITFGGEPIPQCWLTLRATLICGDRTTEQTEILTETGSPLPAVVCCLPTRQSFYADGRNVLRIEIALSAPGTCSVSIAARDNPEEELWYKQSVTSSKSPLVFRWDGKNKKGKICSPGEYVISARFKYRPDLVHTATVTLLNEPQEEPVLAVTGSLIPTDLKDDAAVWKALTAPVTIGNGPEGMGLRIMNGKTSLSGCAGTVSCRTVGLAVLEIGDDHWVKVGAWTQAEGYYTEGYVKEDKLKVVLPNVRYGAVLDKKAQTMTIYEDGKRLGTVLVSTGLTTKESRKADTHSGIYLLGTRMADFVQNGHVYCYPMRIDGFNLIHQLGYAKEGGQRNFEEELARLGTKASHGCIRVDARITAENNGLNAWWIWTHMGHDTKIIVTPED